MQYIKNYVFLLALFCMQPLWSMQKGNPQSLAQLALAAYAKKIVASETMPTQEYIDKVIPKDLHPLIAQMIMKPVVEYLQDWAFRKKLIIKDRFKLPENSAQALSIDKAMRFLVITDTEEKIHIIDIQKSFENFRNNAGPHISATFEDIKTAVLSDNGSLLALINNNNTITIYNAKSEPFEHIRTIEDIPYTINTIFLDSMGSRVYVWGGQNTISVFDVSSGLKKAEYTNVRYWGINLDGNILYITKKDDNKTIITFYRDNKQIAQRVFDNQTIKDLNITDGGIVVALLMQDMAGTKHIDLVSTDLKTIKSLPVHEETVNINMSPKGLYILLYTFDWNLQVLRISDGHILDTKIYIRNATFNPDETRVLFEKKYSTKFELLNLLQDTSIISSEYVNKSNNEEVISFIKYINNNTFSMLSKGNDIWYFKLINFLSDEAMHAIKNISIPQAWILRTLYEANQKKVPYSMVPEIYDVLITLPPELRDPFILDYNLIDKTKETEPIKKSVTEAVQESTVVPEVTKQTISEIEKPIELPTVPPANPIAVAELVQVPVQVVPEAKPVGFFDSIRNGITRVWNTIKSWRR